MGICKRWFVVGQQKVADVYRNGVNTLSPGDPKAAPGKSARGAQVSQSQL